MSDTVNSDEVKQAAEPISDDELQEWRDQLADYEAHGDLRHLLFPGPCVQRLLARLDAAESRPSAEAVQAAVEALKAAAAEFHDHEWETGLKVQMERAIAGLTGGEG